MGDVRTSVADVTIHFSHDANVLIAVEQRVFLISYHAIATRVRSFVRLQTRMGENDNQALGVLVGGRNRDMLLGDKLWEFWRWA